MSVEKSFVLIKPDAIQRGLTGAAFKFILEHDFDITHLSYMPSNKILAEAHLSYYPCELEKFGHGLLDKCKMFNLNAKDYFIRDMNAEKIGEFIHESTLDYLGTGDVYAMVVERENAIKYMKTLCGSTYPEMADKKVSFRGMYGIDTLKRCLEEKHAIHNLIHAADCVSEAEHQINIWQPKPVN